MLTSFIDRVRNLSRTTARYLITSYRTLSRNARLYLISNAIQAVTAGALVVIYTLYLSALGYNTGFIGLVLFVTTVGGGIGIVPSQPLVNRYGWRTMLIWSDIVGGVGIAAQLLLPTPPILLISSLAIGASVAIVLIINAPFLAANSTASDRTALFGLNNAIQFLASIVGSLLGGVLPDWFKNSSIQGTALLHTLAPLLASGDQARSYQLALLVLGLLATPSIIPVFLMSDQPRIEVSPEAPLATSEPHPWRKRLENWRIAVRVGVRGVIGRFSLFQVLLGIGAGFWFPYFNIYVVQRLGASSSFYGALTATATVLLAVASLIAAPLAERFGKVRTIVVSHLCALPFLFLMGAAPFLAVVSITYLIRNVLANIPGPPLQSYLMEAVPERERIVANGVYNVSWQIAWAVGAGIGGIVVAHFGYQAPILLAVPWYSSAVLLFAWFFWHRGSDSEAGKPSPADPPLPASDAMMGD